MAASGALLLATVWLFVVMPKGFLPSEDTGQIFGFTEAAQGISYESMAGHQQALAAMVQQDPNVEAFSSIGASGPNAAGNQGRIFIRLKDRSKRRLSADEVIQELRAKAAAIPGIRIFLQNPPPIRIGGQLTKSLYQLTLQGPDTDELYRRAAELESKLRELPGLQDVTSDLQIRNPQVDISIDRDGPGAGVSAGESRTPSTPPSAAGGSPPLRPHQRVPRPSSCCPSASGTSRTSPPSTSARPVAASCRSRPWPASAAAWGP
jgi:HAE1 family hydrophobic/amphiphilic exporter-1